MGAVLSAVLSTMGLVVAGVTSAYASGKSKDCQSAKKVSTYTSIACFGLALLSMIIMIFLL